MRNPVTAIYNFEPIPGSDIDEVIRYLVDYSEENDCICKATFNAVELQIFHYSFIEADEEVKMFRRWYEEDQDRKCREDKQWHRRLERWLREL